MDTDLVYREKAGWESYKNATSYTKTILDVTYYKKAVV